MPKKGKAAKRVPSEREERAQSATEYLVTYGWAILIVAAILGFLIYFVSAPSYLAPNTCNFVSGTTCKAFIFASNAQLSKIALVVSNAQSYPIVVSNMWINVSGTAYPAKCMPNFVLPGGSIICNATVPKPKSIGTLESGSIYINAKACPYANSSSCISNESYLGKFSAHVSPMLSQIPITISIYTNTSQTADGSKTPLVANVKLLGYPLGGATVYFSTNDSYVNITPNITTTGSDGNAYAQLSSFVKGRALVTATFANVSASIIVNYTPAVFVYFAIPASVCSAVSSSQTIVYINNIAYTCPELANKLVFKQCAKIPYSFTTIVPGAQTGVRFVFVSVSGLGAIGSNGTIITCSNGTVSPVYQTQYYLTMSANPSNGGTVSPSSAWYNAYSTVSISASPNSGYEFVNWTGYNLTPYGAQQGYVPSGAYSGTSESASVTMNNPIDEVANFKLITYTVTFTESGLPSGTTWNVTFNGNTKSSTGTSISFVVTPGTYSYSISNPAYSNGVAYYPSPSSGSVSVSSNTGVSITFSLPPCGCNKANYECTVGNVCSIPITCPSSCPVKHSSTATCGVTVYACKPAVATFTESGLPSGATWSLDFNNTVYSSSDSTITIGNLASGTYSYTIYAYYGYLPNPNGGSADISNSDYSASISYSQSSTTTEVSYFPDVVENNGEPSIISPVTVNGKVTNSTGSLVASDSVLSNNITVSATFYGTYLSFIGCSSKKTVYGDLSYGKYSIDVSVPSSSSCVFSKMSVTVSFSGYQGWKASSGSETCSWSCPTPEAGTNNVPCTVTCN